MLKPDDLLPPETLVDYGEGSCGAVMFHYAAEGDSIVSIAHENGFAICLLRLEDDQREGMDALFERNGEGENVMAEWCPEPPPGWQLAARFDTEDGPVAAFIRRLGDDEGKGQKKIIPTVPDVGRA